MDGGKMIGMKRAMIVCTLLLAGASLCGAQDGKPSYPHFDYETAARHELKPHRRTIPHEGVRGGFNQLHLTLIVSATGDVLEASGQSGEKGIEFWPDLREEVLHWKFVPFEQKGRAVTAEVEEYLDLVPPERLPKVHVTPPVVRTDSVVSISLQRSGCFGSCPSYTVTVSTSGIEFDGGGFVVAAGKHTDTIDPSVVRELAKKFVAADFYSMDEHYSASVTDCPTYILSIDIDGKKKQVLDYMGSWVGMPQVIRELEDEVDEVARTDRWVKGGDGLISALRVEGYNFKTFEAQVMLKEAANRGDTDTVKEMLAAGVSIDPLPAPKPKEEWQGVPFEHEGWLNVASGHADLLKTLIAAGASKNDQDDKDLALFGAANSGNVEGARELIAYGANPNVDLSKLTVTERGAGMSMEGPGSGSVLIAAAGSGNPEMVKLILEHKPKLELRDHDGKTAMFAAGDYRGSDADGARVEIVRLLAKAGADVNVRDENGSTPLHEIFLDDVIEELIKLGADVNARDKDGETPIFTNVSDEAMQIFIDHGADLTIQNKKGETVLEAAEKQHGEQRVEVLRAAIRKHNQE